MSKYSTVSIYTGHNCHKVGKSLFAGGLPVGQEAIYRGACNHLQLAEQDTTVVSFRVALEDICRGSSHRPLSSEQV
jgi:hypothetical protein